MPENLQDPNYTHFVASQMDNAWELQAGCFSQDNQENLETAKVYRIVEDRLYSDWRSMLEAEKGRLNAITVLTPTPLHYEMVCACLEKGYAVICEKALATTSQEAQSILDLKNKLGGFVAVTYNYSGYPMVRELRSRIKSGKLGKILHFQAEMPQEGFIRVDDQGNKPTPQSWRLVDGQLPTIYLDLAVHLHQLIGYLIEAKPVAVVANQDSYGWFPEIIDNVSCLCRYSDGISGTLWFSKSALGHRNGLRLRIYGSEASAEWYQANPEELLLSYGDGRREILDRATKTEIAHQLRYNRFKSGHPAGFIEAFANLYQDIAKAYSLHLFNKLCSHDNIFGVTVATEGLRFLEKISLSSYSNFTNLL